MTAETIEHDPAFDRLAAKLPVTPEAKKDTYLPGLGGLYRRWLDGSRPKPNFLRSAGLNDPNRQAY